MDEVLRWTAAAGDGRFEIRREVGYVAGIANYVLAGELALGRFLQDHMPRREVQTPRLARAGEAGGRPV